MSNVHTLDSLRRRDEERRNNSSQRQTQHVGMPNPWPNQNQPVAKPINHWTKKRKIIHGMIAVNCVAFMGWQLYPELMRKHFLLNYHNIQQQRYYVFLSSVFSHADFIHITFNMISLYFNGLRILDKMSYNKFFQLYFGAGIAGCIAHLFWYVNVKKEMHHSLLGASGALMGMNVVLGLIRFKSFSLIPVEDALSLFLNVFGSTSYSAHLGGSLFGLLFWNYVLKKKRS